MKQTEVRDRILDVVREFGPITKDDLIYKVFYEFDYVFKNMINNGEIVPDLHWKIILPERGGSK